MNTWILSLLGLACSRPLPQDSGSEDSAVQDTDMGQVDDAGDTGEGPTGAGPWCAPLAAPNGQILALGSDDDLEAVLEGLPAGATALLAAGSDFADSGSIAWSHLELTDAGRGHVRNDGYTGGVDAHQARGWEIRDNRGGGIGVALESASQATVVHNTVYATQAPYSSIGCRWPLGSGVIANHLVSHNVRDRGAGETQLSANHEEAPAAWFLDAAGVGSHLAAGAGAVDAGDGSHRVSKDGQGIVRGIPSDVGALKLRRAMPSTRGAG